jgi:hypothetical protein
MWVNLDQVADGSDVAMLGMGKDTDHAFIFYASTDFGDATNQVRVFDDSLGQILVGNDIRGKGWTHIALVRSSDLWILYENGRKVASNTVSGSIYDNTVLRIGTYLFAYNDFEGGIDEVRISDVARSSDEIERLYRLGYEEMVQGTHTSASLNMNDSADVESITWTAVGDDTGDGETPYSTTSLVGQWDFNETSGTTADNEGSCGSSCDGTLYNMTTSGQDAAPGTGWTSDNRRWGNGALMFDGSNDYVSIPWASALRPSNDFSVEAWVNVDELVSGVPGVIINYPDNGGGDDGWGIRVQGTGRIAFYALNSNGWYDQVVESETEVKPGVWYHVVGVYDNSTLKVYVNGHLDNSKSASGDVAYAVTAALNVGRRGGTFDANSQFFDGTIDTLRFYNRVLNASEILSNYQAGNIEMRYRTSSDGSTWGDWSGTESTVESFDSDYLYDTSLSGFLSYWPMEEGSGTTVEDVGYSNDGTASGAYITKGKHGRGRTFDGVNDYISVSDNLSLRLSSGLTLEMWYKTKENPSTWTIPIRKDTQSGTRYLYGVSINSGNTICAQYYNGSNHLACYTSSLVSDGEWHYVVMTISGSTIRLYFDGVLKDSDNITGTQGVPTGELNIGAGPPWTGGGRSSYFEGSIDEVRISNTVGTSQEIYERWIQGSSNPSTLRTESFYDVLEIESAGTTVDANTVGYWTMDEASGTGAYIQDSSSSNNDATPSGTTYINKGKINGARDFDGTDDKITTGTTNRPTNNFTVEAWFTTDVTHQIDVETTTNITGTSGQRYLFGAPNQGSDSGMGVSVGTNGISVYEHGNSYMPSLAVYEAPIPIGWNHLAIVYSSKQPSIYLNGVHVHTGLTSPKTNVYTPYEIGGGSYGYHSGYIDDVRISNRVRTPAEIAEAYAMGRGEHVTQEIDTSDISSNTMLPFWVLSDQLGNNLDVAYGESDYANYEADEDTVGLWHLEEAYGIGSSYFLEDSSGNGNHGDPDGSAYNPPYPEGVRGLAREFNGTDGVIKLGTDSSLSLSSDVTLDAWIKITADDTDTAYRSIIGNTSNSRNYNFYVNGDGSGKWRLHLSHDWEGSGYQGSLSDYILDADEWYHVAGVITTSGGGCHYYYVNGKLVYSSTNRGFTSITGNTLEKRIGSDNGGTWFDGVIDEVRISKTVRTADEIRQTYEVGRRTHPITVDFKADLESSNLISNSGDTSFTISEQDYGTADHIENLDIGEKVVVKEYINTTNYFAQGIVDGINKSTGAVTVDSWLTGSTFPSGGYTSNATLHKWQREYIDIRYPLDEDVNGITRLTFRKTTDVPAMFWIDDLQKATYSSDSDGSSFSTIDGVQYIQYEPIFTKWDPNYNLDLYLSEVEVDYSIGPTMEQLMRHGKWFNSSGVEQPFWWADGISNAPTWVLNFNTAAGTTSPVETNSQTVPENTTIYLSSQLDDGFPTYSKHQDGSYTTWNSGSTETFSADDSFSIRVSLAFGTETKGTITLRENDASGRILDTFFFCIGSSAYCGYIF